MVFRNITLSMTALALCFQMVVAAATISILTFHPDLLSDFEEASYAGEPIEVTCQTVKDVNDVSWDVSDAA